ncbi:MAG: adenosylcobinamide-GDP ribazoletransferase [Kiritimatiellae bacterium]|nr:adenosylcobinamide-GDP ribazoletransferase [Kiritimatiellia bacterium]
MIKNFITAIRTLTILPVPGPETERPADALYFFPLVGALLGGAVAAAAWLLGGQLNWPAGAAVAGVAGLVWLTRALHLDGLSDTIDACFAAPERERRLAIMKDPHIGAFGAAAIVLALLIKAAALERLCAVGCWRWIVLPVILSRTAMVFIAVYLPYARAEGGKAAAFFNGAKRKHFLAAAVTAVLFCLLCAGSAGLPAAAGALIAGLLIMRWMKRAFGGATGDLLGFTGEMTELLLYFLLAAFSTLN